MRRLLLLVVALISFLCSLISIATGSSLPHLMRLRESFGLGTCSRVCWHDIQLGTTTLADAERILSADPNITLLGDDYSGCPISWRQSVDATIWQGHICSGKNPVMPDPVLEIRLDSVQQETTFTLLDAIFVFGQPIQGTCFLTYHKNDLVTAKDYLAMLSFQNADVSVQRDSYYDGLAFDPAMPVTQILYRARDLQPYSQWRGFTVDHTQPACFKIHAS